MQRRRTSERLREGSPKLRNGFDHQDAWPKIAMKKRGYFRARSRPRGIENARNASKRGKSMRNSLLLLGLLAGISGVACAEWEHQSDGNADAATGTRIQPNLIPAYVRSAANAEQPGMMIEWAELTSDGGVYCVHGTVNGWPREVSVGEDGQVLNPEHGRDGMRQ